MAACSMWPSHTVIWITLVERPSAACLELIKKLSRLSVRHAVHPMIEVTASNATSAVQISCDEYQFAAASSQLEVSWYCQPTAVS